MIRLQTEKGEVSISDAALSNITGAAATSCFGVKGNIDQILRRERKPVKRQEQER